MPVVLMLSNCPCAWVFLSAEPWDREAQTSLPQLGLGKRLGSPETFCPGSWYKSVFELELSQEICLLPISLDFPILKWEYCDTVPAVLS